MTAQIVTVGTTPLTFAQFSYAPSNVATLAGTNTFANAVTAPVFVSNGAGPWTSLTERANAITPASGFDYCDQDSTAHGILCSFNGDAAALVLRAGHFFSLTINTGTTFNFTGGNEVVPCQSATPSAVCTGTLPVASAASFYCSFNGNGGAANTGVITLQTSGTGQYIVYTDGTLSASGGYVASSGAAGDYGCVIGIDSTHWKFQPVQGAWAKF
jgi:hypothetical protein